MRDTGRLGRRPRAALLISPAMDLSPGSCMMRPNWPAASVAGNGGLDYLPREHVADGLLQYYVDRSVGGRGGTGLEVGRRGGGGFGARGRTWRAGCCNARTDR
jgi:hypothetical protein